MNYYYLTKPNMNILNSNHPPKRGFTFSEFKIRLLKSQKVMHKHINLRRHIVTLLAVDLS